MQCVYVMNRSIKKNIHRLGTKKKPIWDSVADLEHADVDLDQQIRDDVGFGSC